jgi:hypothetical protein
MSVDCPHRERRYRELHSVLERPASNPLSFKIILPCRGYGGDGHTSMQFALQNFQVLPCVCDLCSRVSKGASLINTCHQVGAFFNKWTRDFADVQEPSGEKPAAAC